MTPRRKVTRWNEGEGVRNVRRPTKNMAAPTSTQIPAASPTIHPYRRGAACGASSISNRQSPIACSRCFGSFCKQDCSRRRTFIGTRSQSGSFVTTAARTSVIVSPGNACRPVNISYSTTPNAQMSARRSTACPRACSGAM